MKGIFLFLNLILLIGLCKSQDCSFPWQKVNDDVCLFLTSITKTWDHAKLLCHFYGGDLLYIKNDIEQKNIQKYLSKLIKYRYNKKPYIWLDATDRSVESEWLWSRNNRTVNYENWIPSYHNSGVHNSKSMLNCGCYKPNNGYWKDCDCSLRQHFTCRKSMILEDYNEDRLDNAKKMESLIIEETPQMAGFTSSEEVDNDLANDLTIDLEMLEHENKENENELKEEVEEFYDLVAEKDSENEKEKRIEKDESENEEILDHNKHDYDTISGNLLLDNISTTSKSPIPQSDSDEINFDLIVDDELPADQSKVYQNIIKRMFESPEEVDREISESRIKEQVKSKMSTLTRFNQNIQKSVPKIISFETIMRIRVNKNENLYKDYHCTKGPGYYAIENSQCTKYKYCEDWNADYAAMSINKCQQNSIFDFRMRKCVQKTIENQCDLTIDFVTEN